MSRRSVQSVCLLACLLCAGLVAHARADHVIDSPRSLPVRPHAVFILNGAGDWNSTTEGTAQAVARGGLPIEAITFPWSHGGYRIVADQTDLRWSTMQGRRLAAVLREHRRQHPEQAIHLLGHSAGAQPMLAALEALPDSVVDNVAIISPTISSRYDLRPALRSIDGTMTIYYSRRDWVYNGLVMRIVGNADRRHTISAGRVGFRCCLTPGLAGKLEQRPWTPGDRRFDFNGSHFTGHEPRFLDCVVLRRLIAGG